MKSTVINTSKEMMCYSDFPIPEEYPFFMHNTYVQKYFNLYAEKFSLKKHVQFETEVTKYSYKQRYIAGGEGFVVVIVW
jgi:dimethylaniline monooxygenase (N-oxide forming)